MGVSSPLDLADALLWQAAIYTRGRLAWIEVNTKALARLAPSVEEVVTLTLRLDQVTAAHVPVTVEPEADVPQGIEPGQWQETPPGDDVLFEPHPDLGIVPHGYREEEDDPCQGK